MTFREECVCFSIAISTVVTGVALGWGFCTLAKMLKAAFTGGI